MRSTVPTNPWIRGAACAFLALAVIAGGIPLPAFAFRACETDGALAEGASNPACCAAGPAEVSDACCPGTAPAPGGMAFRALDVVGCDASSDCCSVAEVPAHEPVPQTCPVLETAPRAADPCAFAPGEPGTRTRGPAPPFGPMGHVPLHVLHAAYRC